MFCSHHNSQGGKRNNKINLFLFQSDFSSPGGPVDPSEAARRRRAGHRLGATEAKGAQSPSALAAAALALASVLLACVGCAGLAAAMLRRRRRGGGENPKSVWYRLNLRRRGKKGGGGGGLLGSGGRTVWRRRRVGPEPVVRMTDLEMSGMNWKSQAND